MQAMLFSVYGYYLHVNKPLELPFFHVILTSSNKAMSQHGNPLTAIKLNDDSLFFVNSYSHSQQFLAMIFANVTVCSLGNGYCPFSAARCEIRQRKWDAVTDERSYLSLPGTLSTCKKTERTSVDVSRYSQGLWPLTKAIVEFAGRRIVRVIQNERYGSAAASSFVSYFYYYYYDHRMLLVKLLSFQNKFSC